MGAGYPMSGWLRCGWSDFFWDRLLGCRSVRRSFNIATMAALVAALAFGRIERAKAQANGGGSVVFLLAAELSPTIRASLTDALEAQLTGTGTTLHWHTLTGLGTDLRAAIDQGKPLSEEHAALGVFWLDASGSDDWLLYLMDASGERVLARRIEAAAASPAATIEAIAVIVREAAAALVAGRPIAMAPVATVPADPAPEPAVEPTAPIAPAPAPPTARSPIAASPPTAPPTQTPGAFRFALSYVGSPLSEDQPWQSGLGLQLSAFHEAGLFVGLGYTLLPTINARAAGFALTVHRRPIRVLFGAGMALGRSLRVDAEGAGLLDVATRTTLSTPETAEPTRADTKLIVGASIAARLSWIPQPSVELFLSLGADVFLNRFDYVSERDGMQQTLLSPWPLSPTAELGIAFRP